MEINQRIYFKYFSILIILILPTSIFAGHPDSVYMKINVSNTNPAINELVTINLEFELNRTYNNGDILVGSIDTSIKYISGEKRWTGIIEKGERIHKKYIIKFTEEKIHRILINVSQNDPMVGFGKIIYFCVGKAFEENEKVMRLKRNIEVAKRLLNPPKNEFVGEYNFDPPGKLDSIFSTIKPYNKLDKETERKNDSLLVKLKKEYKELLKRYKEKTGYKIEIKD
jgi:hypothetical protein